MSNLSRIGIGEACSRLLANPSFEQFLDEVRQRRELVVESMTLGRCDSYEEYLEKRAECNALSQLLELPHQLRDEAIELREQDNG